jgi:hypothetical protein
VLSGAIYGEKQLMGDGEGSGGSEAMGDGERGSGRRRGKPTGEESEGGKPESLKCDGVHLYNLSKALPRRE